MTGTGPLFSISAVARMIGVPVATLRTWEDRYSLVVPERTPSRHRLYTREQLEQLQFIKARIDEGVSAADAHRLLGERSEIETQSPPTSGRESPSPPGKGPLVLLAENDPFSAEFQEYFLKAEGFRVTSALDFDSAVNAFKAAPPALVVVDLLVSGGLGLDLCRYLKDQKGSHHRVLAVSSLESESQALNAGADAFLPKPLDPVVYLSTVNELLGSGATLADQSGAT